MKVLYREAAKNDIVRQFRYYLLTVDSPQVALRFRDAVRRTIALLRERPHVGAHYRSEAEQLRNMRSWPVNGFESIRIYYLLEDETVQVIRILHGSRDIERALATQG